MSDERHDDVDDLVAQLRPPTEAEGQVRGVYMALGGLQAVANELSQAISHRGNRHEFRRLPPGTQALLRQRMQALYQDLLILRRELLAGMRLPADFTA